MNFDEYKLLLENIQDDCAKVDHQNKYASSICRIQTQLAFEISTESKQTSLKINYQKGIAESCKIIGNCYLLFGDYKTSIIELETALNIFREFNDKTGEAESINLYGIVYSLMGNYELSIKNFEISLNIMRSLKNNEGIVRALNSIGDSLMRLKNFKKAQKTFDEAINIEHDNEIYKGIIQYNISEIHYSLNEFDQAEKSLLLCKKIGDQLKFELMYIYCAWLQGRIDIKKGNFIKAEKLLKYALRLAKKVNAKDRIFNILEDLAKLFELKNEYKTSLKFYKEYVKIKDEVINEESLKIIKTLEHKNEVSILKTENEFEQKKNIELNLAYKEIEIQKDLISIKNQEITDSITYAKRIQEAILPSDEMMSELLPNSFIIYQPKDILSGDFYWASKVKTNNELEYKLVAVADCTGHGVPGALLSIVGNNFLRLCEAETTVNSPSQALDFLNKGLCETLRQKSEESSIKDGMDVSFIAIDEVAMKVIFSGAKHSLYIIRDFNFIEIKGDKYPIGSFLDEDLKQFTNHEFQIEKGDQIYLFTDGYSDQFGGPLGKKFRPQNLKALLISISHLNLEEQKRLILENFNKWKGDLEQVDDVCMFSTKF